MEDPTENVRRQRVAELAAEADERFTLEARHGRVWNTDQLRQDFEVRGFSAPFVIVRRKSDNAIGSLEFQHSPRYYFNWLRDK
jgi:hypothetical protein